MKKLKDAGKADPDGRQPIPEPALRELSKLMSTMHKILKCKDKTTAEYKNLVSLLPKDYQNSYHKLLVWLAMYDVMLAFGLRGREGIKNFKRAHFVKKFDEEENCHFWKQEKFVSTKTMKRESQKKETGGIIPFIEIDGVNLGEFFEDYLKHIMKVYFKGQEGLVKTLKFTQMM